ncbi:hypothetical protein CHH28_06185 [Bacterioplanes sanyensis]|uniref:Uncharacterized protein n=1 Tax=Bacterioplanes sanyensis TaxID=1249553 RepID=A0A222FJ87_9GAMM|nr:hypothetical protein CHH28_06185 [Bacterioplanes sanyensis]
MHLATTAKAQILASWRWWLGLRSGHTAAMPAAIFADANLSQPISSYTEIPTQAHWPHLL